MSDQEWGWIINDTFEGVQIDQTLQKVGFNRTQFSQYLNDLPEKKAEYDKAQIDSCKFIENDILNAHKKYKDPKVAKLAIDAAKMILAFRNPEKYGNKIDLNVNKTVSIKAAISMANERVAKLVKDIVVIPLASGGTKQQK